jgi:transposase
MKTRKPISEETKEQLLKMLKESRTKSDFQRIQCVWMRAALDLPLNVIATAVTWNENHVKKVHSQFLRNGVEILEGSGRGGRHNENLTTDEEERLLKPFIEKAQNGSILVASEIKLVYEKEVGHTVPKSTIYRMLARHGWRKIAPRPKHPKADPNVQEAFKKTSYTD